MISASRGAAILGQSKYSEPLDEWCKIVEALEPGFCEKNGYPLPEFVDNNAVRWGLLLEDYIVAMAEKHHDLCICDRERFYQADGYDYITCHIDGQFGAEELHEAKTVNSRTYHSEWGEPGTDQIPRGYMIQVQHQMLCSGADKCIVSALVLPKMQDELGDPRELSGEQVFNIANALYDMGYYHQYVVDKNEKLQKLMLEKYVEFWNENVLKRIPPNPVTTEWVKKLIPEPMGTVVLEPDTPESDQIRRWSTELTGIKQEKKAVSGREKELKKLILDFMRKRTEGENIVIDKESRKKINLLDSNGFKLHSYNGKTFR